MPSYLKLSTLFISITLDFLETKFFGTGLFIVWNCMSLVLSSFVVNLLAIHQLYRSVNFDFISVVNAVKFEYQENKAVWSANKRR